MPMARARGGSPIETPWTIANALVASGTWAPARSNARTMNLLRRLRSRRTCSTKLPSGDSGLSAPAQPPSSSRRSMRTRSGSVWPAPGRQRPTTNGSRSAVTDGCSMRTGRPAAGAGTRAAGVASSPTLPAYSAAPRATMVMGSAPAEHLADARAQPRHQRRPADEDDARDVVSRALVLGEQHAHRGQAARDERLGQRLQIAARDLQLALDPVAGGIGHDDRCALGA